MEWFRAYHGAPFDTKLAVVAKRAGKPRGMVAAVWWAVLDCASQAVTRGNAVKLDIEEIAVSFDWESDDILTIVRAMRDKGMIGKDGEIIAWEKRQPKREDNSTERVRRFRETQRNTMKHGNGVEQSREEKNREDKPPKPPSGQFDIFWKAYPHKIGKGAAESAFKRLIGGVDLDTILAGLTRYRLTKPAHIDWCHPATWLNQKRWLDEPAQIPERGGTVSPMAGRAVI